VTNALFEGAVGRLARLFQDSSLDVVKPTVIAATQATIFNMSKLQRGSAVRAAESEKPRPASIIAKKDEVLS
jgi:hypothetical protein